MTQRASSARIAFDGPKGPRATARPRWKLVQLKVDVILTATEGYVNAARQAARIIRTVFPIVSDPVAGRMVA